MNSCGQSKRFGKALRVIPPGAQCRFWGSRPFCPASARFAAGVSGPLVSNSFLKHKIAVRNFAHFSQFYSGKLCNYKTPPVLAGQVFRALAVKPASLPLLLPKEPRYMLLDIVRSPKNRQAQEKQHVALAHVSCGRIFIRGQSGV